jgi:hypothetical protein
MADRVTLDGPVGLRFRKQNVKNNASDQDKIIGLLAKIPKAQGGKKEEWRVPPLSGANGSCPGFVSDAIWDFQQHWKTKGHFQHIDGVVDPDKNTLAQLTLLAAGVTPPKPPPGPSTPFVTPLKQNPVIVLDGTRAVERTTPIHPAEWVRRTQETFDTLCANAFGRQIVMGRRRRVFVEPYRFDDLNAHSSSTAAYQSVLFTAENFDSSASKPGCRADEILLHELLHLVENNFGGYDDNPGIRLEYARSDFLTIIGTNVYSSILGRGLRADHDKYRFMPSPFDADPAQHVTAYHANYGLIRKNSRGVFDLLRIQPAAWNPFKIYTP